MRGSDLKASFDCHFCPVQLISEVHVFFAVRFSSVFKDILHMGLWYKGVGLDHTRPETMCAEFLLTDP